MILVTHNAGIGFPPVVLVCVAIVAACATAVLMWVYVPWWRKFPSPRRQHDDDRDYLRAWKIRKRHPEAFSTNPLPPPRTPASGEEGDA